PVLLAIRPPAGGVPRRGAAALVPPPRLDRGHGDVDVGAVRRPRRSVDRDRSVWYVGAGRRSHERTRHDRRARDRRRQGAAGHEVVERVRASRCAPAVLPSPPTPDRGESGGDGGDWLVPDTRARPRRRATIVWILPSPAACTIATRSPWNRASRRRLSGKLHGRNLF